MPLELFINGEIQDSLADFGVAASATVFELLSVLETKLQAQGSVVSSWKIDGAELTQELLATLQVRTLLDDGKLEVAADSPKQASLNTINGLRESLTKMLEQIDEAIVSMTGSKEHDTKQRVETLIAGWSGIQEAVAVLCQFARIDPQQTAWPDAPHGEADAEVLAALAEAGAQVRTRSMQQGAGEFAGQLEIVINGLESQDPMRVIDALVYELAPRMAGFSTVLDYLEQRCAG